MPKVKQSDDVIREAATTLFKYQNFKSTSLKKRIGTIGKYQHSSLVALHSLARAYLATGKRDLKRVSPVFYETLDNCLKSHVQPLVPTNKELAQSYRAIPKRGAKKSSSVKITKTEPSNVSRMNKIPNFKPMKVVHSQLGLQFENRVMICESEDYMNGYIQAFEDMKNELGRSVEFKKVKLNIVEC